MLIHSLRVNRKEAIDMPTNFGPTEIGIVVFIIILLFGTRKIPELMRGIGLTIKEFKKALMDK